MKSLRMCERLYCVMVCRGNYTHGNYINLVYTEITILLHNHNDIESNLFNSHKQCIVNAFEWKNTKSAKIGNEV